MFDRRLQVKKYAAVVHNSWGDAFRVFTTGDEKFYLFDQLDPGGCSTGFQFPVRKADLRRDVRRALANGWGN